MMKVFAMTKKIPRERERERKRKGERRRKKHETRQTKNKTTKTLYRRHKNVDVVCRLIDDERKICIPFNFVQNKKKRTVQKLLAVCDSTLMTHNPHHSLFSSSIRFNRI